MEVLVARLDQRRRAARAHGDDIDLGVIEPQVQEAIIELAERAQRPRLGARLRERIDILGGLRATDQQARRALRVVERELDILVRELVVRDLRIERGQRERRAAHDRLLRSERLRGIGDRGIPLRARHEVIDEAPLLGALALDAFGRGAEHIGAIAAHLALVDEPREPARAGKHREERRLREAHRGVAVIHQHRLGARERELVSAARRRPLACSERGQPRVLAGILEVQPRFVRELAEVHLERVGREPEHVDVRAGAEHPVEIRAEHHALHLGMLEAQPLDRIRELDIDREVVRVQLQLVTGLVRVGIVDRHREAGDVALDGKLPVVVAARMSLEGRRIHELGLSGTLLLVTLIRHALYCRCDVPRIGRQRGPRPARAAGSLPSRAGRIQRPLRAVPGPARDRRRQYLAPAVCGGRARARHHARGTAFGLDRARAQTDRAPRRPRRGQIHDRRRTREEARCAVRRARSGDRGRDGPVTRRCLHHARRGLLPPRRARGPHALARRECADRAGYRWLDRQRPDHLRPPPLAGTHDLSAREARRPLEPRRRPGRSAADGREPARIRRAPRPDRGAREALRARRSHDRDEWPHGEASGCRDLRGASVERRDHLLRPRSDERSNDLAHRSYSILAACSRCASRIDVPSSAARNAARKAALRI